MDEYIRKINIKLQTINRERAFHEDTVLSLIALIRQHLEINKLKPQYKTTSFFCDWCLHTTLDRNKKAVEILHRINEALNDENIVSLNDRVNEIISLHQLRKELVEISNLSCVPSILFTTYDGWKAFTRILLNCLVRKPIKTHEHLPYKRYALELSLEIHDLSSIDNAYLTQNSISTDTVFWKVLVEPTGYILTGPLVNVESPCDF